MLDSVRTKKLVDAGQAFMPSVSKFSKRPEQQVKRNLARSIACTGSQTPKASQKTEGSDCEFKREVIIVDNGNQYRDQVLIRR